MHNMLEIVTRKFRLKLKFGLARLVCCMLCMLRTWRHKSVHFVHCYIVILLVKLIIFFLFYFFPVTTSFIIRLLNFPFYFFLFCFCLYSFVVYYYCYYCYNYFGIAISWYRLLLLAGKTWWPVKLYDLLIKSHITRWNSLEPYYDEYTIKKHWYQALSMKKCIISA